MKTKLLFTVTLLIFFNSFAQTDGWFLYAKPYTIYKIIPDDTNSNELHIATDIGYIKYNTTTNTVTNFLNLTSQNPAVGRVNGLSLNPINNNIALALDDGIAIYDGTTVTVYNYTNSALTVGSVGGTQFTKLKVRYGRQGELYIFKPDVTGYQVFNAGVFNAEVSTVFTPQDITENLAGTKVFFAGSNDGLHELTKASNNWVNYTSSNSNLFQNFLTALFVDGSDNLLIGHYQGLNKMEPNGTITTCNASSPIPVFAINENIGTGELLVRNSEPNTSSVFGFSVVDYDACSWSNYTNDATNCLDNNIFNTVTFGGDGNIYVAKSFVSIGEIFKFVPGTDTCTQIDINYLNAPTVTNFNFVSDFTVRKKASGNLDVGFTKGESLYILEIDPNTFNGVFPAVTTLTPSPGQPAYSVLSDNAFFIVENNTGWTFVDDANNITSFNHNLPNYLAIVTKKAAAFDSSSGIINLIFKGFDAAFNYRVYKTQCNTATATCSVPEEMFTNDRDFSQNVAFGCSEDPNTNEVNVACVKTNSKGVLSSTCESWTNNSPAAIKWDEAHPEYTFLDPILYILNTIIMITFPDFFTIQTRDGNGVLSSSIVDSDNDGNPEEVKSINSTTITEGEADVIIRAFLALSKGGMEGVVIELFNQNGSDANANQNAIDTKLTIVPDIKLDNGLPEDLFISKFEIKQYNPTDAFIVVFTNYGLLMKTAIDISNLILSTDDASLKDNGLLLYPNPANNIVSFSDNTIKNIEVYDINGRRVLNIKNTSSFSVKSLTQGVYIVKGTSDNHVVVTKKLIVE